MSSQGAASNVNGLLFRRRIQEQLDIAGVSYSVETPKYADALGTILRHDLILHLPSGDVVVECKYHGTARGSIGQKLAYTAMWVAELKVPTIIVVGGYWPQYIVDRVRAHCSSVRVMYEDEWKVWLASGANSW